MLFRSSTVRHSSRLLWHWRAVVAGIAICLANNTPLCAADPKPGSEEAKASDKVERIRAAVRSAWDSIRSGRGRGVISGTLGPDSVPHRDARFELAFSGDKYYIRLDYRPVGGKPPMYSRVITVCDGSAVASAWFSTNAKPGGCEIRVFDRTYAAVATATHAAMTNEPLKHPRLLAVGPILNDKLSVEGGADGLLHLTDHTTTCFEFLADPRQGFNIVMMRQQGKGDDGVLYETTRTGEWKEQGGVWFLRKLEELQREDGVVIGRGITAFEEFSPNVAVEDSEFTWQRFQACSDGIVLDDRTDAPARSYRLVPGPESEERRLNTIVEHVQSLPQSVGPRNPVPAPSPRLYWGVGILIAAVVCGVLAYLSRSFARR